jgi:hypothetical protein
MLPEICIKINKNKKYDLVNAELTVRITSDVTIGKVPMHLISSKDSTINLKH